MESVERTIKTSWPSLLLPTLKVNDGEERRTIDAVAGESLARREARPQGGQFLRRRGDDIDFGVHRLVQRRIQVDLAEPQRPRRVDQNEDTDRRPANSIMRGIVTDISTPRIRLGERLNFIVQ